MNPPARPPAGDPDRDGPVDGSGDDPIWPAGWHVRHVAETGSTNADLLAAAVRGAPDRSVLVADHQTAGRGRLDRRWDAPPGANLLVSILFRDLPRDPGELVRRVGVAAVEAVAPWAHGEVRLKWPNDVLLDGCKLAGVLAQRGAGAAADAVVVGIGINVGWAPDGAARLDGGPRPVTVLVALLEALDRLPPDVFDRYRSLLDTLGRRVRVELPAGELTGTAVAVEPDGRLVVVDECAITHRVGAGDVVHLRPG